MDGDMMRPGRKQLDPLDTEHHATTQGAPRAHYVGLAAEGHLALCGLTGNRAPMMRSLSLNVRQSTTGLALRVIAERSLLRHLMPNVNVFEPH